MTPRVVLAIAPTLALLTVTLSYGLLCWVKPFRTCNRCAGTGQTTTRFLHRPRRCRHCDHGQRLRFGRRVYNRLRRLHADATR